MSAALDFNERRHDPKRRQAVSLRAAQAFNRETVRLLAHGEIVDPGAVWDACVAQAVKDTEWSLIPERCR